MHDRKKGMGIIMNENEYRSHAKKTAQPSPILKDCLAAFFVGGLICTIGEVLNSLYSMRLNGKDSAALTSVTLIFAAVLLTGTGVFDRIASFAGAGTLVPITGFANAVASSAIDSRFEGYVLGVGAKIFAIAGPVILYGTAAGVVYGVIYWICTM